MVTKSIFNKVFGHSPIKPLEAHMTEVNSCVKHLAPFFESVFAEDWANAEKKQAAIVDLENAADQRKRDLRLNLPKSLLLPVARSDLLELVSMQDRIANKAKDIAGLILGRKMTFPSELKTDLPAYVARCIDVCHLATNAINELDRLMETGFSGSEVTLVDKMVTELDSAETDTDNMQVKLRRTLYGMEEALPAVHVIFLYKIIEWVGDVADLSQKVGDRLQILIAR